MHRLEKYRVHAARIPTTGVLLLFIGLLCGNYSQADFISSPGVVARLPDATHNAAGMSINIEGEVYIKLPGSGVFTRLGQSVQPNADMYADYLAFGNNNQLYTCNTTGQSVVVPTTGITQEITLTGGTCAGLSYSHNMLHVLVNGTATQKVMTFSTEVTSYPIIYEVMLSAMQGIKYNVMVSNKNKLFLGSTYRNDISALGISSSMPSSAEYTFDVDYTPTALASMGDMLCSASASAGQCYAVYTDAPLIVSSATTMQLVSSVIGLSVFGMIAAYIV